MANRKSISNVGKKELTVLSRKFSGWHWFDEKLPNGIAEYAI